MKPLRFLFVIIVASLMVSCANEEQVFTYNVNDTDYSNIKINWFSQGDWGNSADGILIKVGEYAYTAGSISLIEKKASPASFDQAFYSAGGMKTDYRIGGDFTIGDMEIRDGIYNKFGFYAAYKNAENYVQVFLHPLDTEHFVSVNTIVDGAWETVWRIIEIPDEVDFSGSVRLDVLKVGGEFRIYVNEVFVGTVLAAIDEAQVGVLSEEITYTINNFEFTEITEFPTSTIGWGEASDNGIPKSGSYDITSVAAVIYGTNAASQIFTEATYDDFTIRTKLSFEPIDVLSPMRYGLFLLYEDVDNYVRLYFEDGLDSLTIERREQGVSEIETATFDDIEDVVYVDFYKIGTEFRIYFDDTLKYSGTIDIESGQIGLHSENARGVYGEFTITLASAFPVETWSGSYDGLTPRRGAYTYIEEILTFPATAMGGYDAMEQVFYNGTTPMVNFIASVILYHAAPSIDVNNKYGIRLYNSPDDYIEFFIIPNLNAIYLVSQIDGAFAYLWTNVYTFPVGFDFTVSGDAFRVVKTGADFAMYWGETLIHSFSVAAYADLAMQVALVAEKTAPVYFAEFAYTSTEVVDTTWGGSYDDELPLSGDYTYEGGELTILTTAMGGYGAMEQIFYIGADPLAGFIVSAKMRHDGSLVIDANNKYGFLLYNSPDNYLELYIIPNLNAVYAVSKVGGAFGYLWTSLYTFDVGYDHTAGTQAFAVKKDGATFTLYLDDVEISTFDIAAFETLAMQVALVAEKTAPVYFAEFAYTSTEVVE